MYFSLKCTASLCLLFGFQYVWPYRVNFQAYWIFLILLWDKTNCAFFIYSVKFSSYNVKTYVNFCKNEPRFMPLTIFHLNRILLLMMKIIIKQFSLQSWKIRAECWNPLKISVIVKRHILQPQNQSPRPTQRSSLNEPYEKRSLFWTQLTNFLAIIHMGTFR